MSPYKWPYPEAAQELAAEIREYVDSAALEARDGAWIRSLMDLLGMSDDELAKKLGVSQPVVTRLRHSEADGRITLNKLGDIAEELDADLIYALVPRQSFATQCKDRQEEVQQRRIKHRRLKPKQRRRS